MPNPAKTRFGNESPSWPRSSSKFRTADLRLLLMTIVTGLSLAVGGMLAIGRSLISHPHLRMLDDAIGGVAPQVHREIWARPEIIAMPGVAVVLVDINICADFRPTTV